MREIRFEILGVASVVFGDRDVMVEALRQAEITEELSVVFFTSDWFLRRLRELEQAAPAEVIYQLGLVSGYSHGFAPLRDVSERVKVDGWKFATIYHGLAAAARWPDRIRQFAPVVMTGTPFDCGGEGSGEYEQLHNRQSILVAGGGVLRLMETMISDGMGFGTPWANPHAHILVFRPPPQKG